MLTKDRTGPPRRRVHRAWALALLALSGCAMPVDGVEEELEVAGTHEELFAYKNAVLWTNGQVPICFNGRGTSKEATWLKNALADSWAAVARIDFTYSNTCPFPGKTNYIHVNWVASTGWGVGGESGVGMDDPQVLSIGYCNNGNCDPVEYEEAFKSVAVHEVGHALGFAHEHQRNDAKLPAGCIAPRPTDRAGADNWDLNNAVIADGIKLTSYYDADSVMNYCRGFTTKTGTYALGYHATERLSPGDLRGAQQQYGIRMPYWLTASLL